MKKRILLIIILNVNLIFSQNNGLTHHISSKERALINSQIRSFTETAPPVGEIRNIAEWEPMESVIVAYTGEFGVPLSLISEMAEATNVTTIVSNMTEENIVRNIYSTNGVNLSHCNFVYQDPDSWWTRDYSPWYISVDNSEIAIVNFPYNRPRPNDNDVPVLLANELGIDLYGMNVTHTGGNIMCDGYGNAASTDLVWEENTDKTHAQINAKMQEYLGIDSYHVTIDPLDEYIKHIDCWGKYLDVDKVLITQVPVTDYRYNNYELVANYFATQNCPWGYPYEVIRVQAADYNQGDINPYSNSLFLNNKIFVPQTGSSLDNEALIVYENAMPGYEIIGVYSSGWYNSDALHCRTHGVPDREMIFIKHFPLHGEVESQSSFTIEANVYSYSSNTTINNVKLFYKQNNGAWQEEVMTNSSGTIYTVDIPAIVGAIEVEYYIYAEDNNAKTETLPRFGDIEPFNFTYIYNELAVTNFQYKNNIKVVPNPSNGLFRVETEMNIENIQLYDVNGKKVNVIFKLDNEIDASNLESGIYFIKIEGNYSTNYSKISIK